MAKNVAAKFPPDLELQSRPTCQSSGQGPHLLLLRNPHLVEVSAPAPRLSKVLKVHASKHFESAKGGVLYYIPFTKLISFNKQFFSS